MRPRRHIRCPKCNLEGHVPEGFAKPRIRCPNPDCRHVFDVSPASELAAESEGYAQKLAAALREAAARGGESAAEWAGPVRDDEDVPAGPMTGVAAPPPPAPPAAQPSSTDAGTRPGRGEDAPAVPRSEPEDAGGGDGGRWRSPAG